MDYFNKVFLGSQDNLNDVISIHSWFSDFETLNVMPIVKALYAQLRMNWVVIICLIRMIRRIL